MNTFEAGAVAEAAAMSFERLRLGLPNAAPEVRLVSENTSLGYDIESVDSVGGDTLGRYIEVKCANKREEVLISDNEVRVLKALGKAAWIYVVDLQSGNVVRMIQDPFGSGKLQPEPVSYRLKV